MTCDDVVRHCRERLMGFFLEAAKPREQWLVGMELEKLGRTREGRPIPFSGQRASVIETLRYILASRGGRPVCEAEHLIGIDAEWGAISLEPGGQVEWSSRPRATLDALREDLEAHLATMRRAGAELGIDWLEVAVDPELNVAEMPWMPKARYAIMRPYLGERGRLAHRMMTQSASIQVAFDYSDPEDWRKKFKAAALLTPVAVALFANSSRVDGGDSGYRSYRQVIWRETDPDRCGLPASVFGPGFDLETWLDYALGVPTMFRHRARGLVATGGTPFREMLRLTGCDAMKPEDWETHLSAIFTDVRSYGYIEVRSADLQPDGRSFAVPVFWTGLLYHPEVLDDALELGSGLDDPAAWAEAMESAARLGLAGRAAGRPLAGMAGEALALARRGLRGGAACAGDAQAQSGVLDELAALHGIEIAG